jgi:hypothetical protein
VGRVNEVVHALPVFSGAAMWVLLEF